jgi:hypothetical protein
MKAEELFRNVPASIHELYLALAGLHATQAPPAISA